MDLGAAVKGGWRERATAWLDREAPLIDADDPAGISRLDRLDGVGATRTGMPHPRKHDDLEDDGDDD